jgi:hypothetical protein
LYSAVTGYIQSNAVPGWADLNKVIGGLKATDLRWANALELKNTAERAFTESFGAKQTGKPTKVRACDISPSQFRLTVYTGGEGGSQEYQNDRG